MSAPLLESHIASLVQPESGAVWLEARVYVADDADVVIAELRAQLAEQARTLETLTKERDACRTGLRDLCEEWNEGCEPTCDSWGHVEQCRGTNLAAAKRHLQIRAAQADAALLAQRETLERFVNAAVSTRDIVMDANHKLYRLGHNPSWVKASDLLAVLDPQKP